MPVPSLEKANVRLDWEREELTSFFYNGEEKSVM